jgi:hypothetical protein
LPLPGSPVRSAKPPSRTRRSSRQQKVSSSWERHSAVDGQVGRRQSGGGVLLHQAAQQGRDAGRRGGRLAGGGSGGLARPSEAVGVAAAVEQQAAIEHGAGVLVDEHDLTQVPGGEADRQAVEVTEAVGDLEAPAGDADRAVASALGAHLPGGEGEAEIVERRRGPADAGPAQPPLPGRLAGLRVHRALVLALDPGQGGAVELRQRQLGLAVEHGHEPSFDLGPHDLLLAVLVRAVGQRRVVEDTQAGQPLGGLLGEHRGPVVGQKRPRQAAFEEGLGQPVDEASGGLVEGPLGVADQPRAIVEHGEKNPRRIGCTHSPLGATILRERL